MTETKTKHWLNPVLDSIEQRYPEGEIVVSSGISPSASYHIGHFREILSADLVKVGLQLRGRSVKHLHVVDNFDPLRKRYDFLPASFESYVGWPVCLVPDPEGDCHDSYAEHFFQRFYRWVEYMGIEVEVVRAYQDLYANGRMSEQIEKVVEHGDQIREIFKEVANRDLEDDWMALQILGDNGFNDWHYSSLNKQTKQITATDGQGSEHLADYSDGHVKLNWRLDWPARWQVLGVMVEPHGFQEHGASGGSFDTGRRFAKEVFGFDPPLAGFQYGHLHLAGDSIKMSSSKGNLVTPDEAFKIMPPEMLRYFYARYPGKKRIDFDPGIGLFRMIDEYAAVAAAVKDGRPHEFEAAYNLANEGKGSQEVSTVPFSHLVSVYQAALGDSQKALQILSRSEYAKEAEAQKAALLKQFDYVANWLRLRAPEEIKFSLQQAKPSVVLSEQQKSLLGSLAQLLESDPAQEPEALHMLVHTARESVGLEPKPAFEAIYLALLGKSSGPKAGWFMSIIDRDFLISRFREMAS